MRVILMIFQKKKKKKCVWVKWTILGPKIVHPHNSRSAVSLYFLICLYQKKFFQQKWAIFGPKIAHPHNYGSAVRTFLKFCRMKGTNNYMKIVEKIREKIHLGQFDLFSF